MTRFAEACQPPSKLSPTPPTMSVHVATMLPGGSVTAWKPLEMLGTVLHHVAIRKGLQTVKAIDFQR